MRESTQLSSGWHFYPQGDPACISRDVAGAYEVVTVPHDYVISREAEEDCPSGDSQGYRRRDGVVYYTKDLTCAAPGEKEQLFLEFDGVYENCTVYVNGEEAGRHAYGYTGFTLEVTSFVTEGQNRIAVRVDNSHIPGDRWYSGGGIYRPVRLTRMHRCHIIPESVFVRTGEMRENGTQVLVSFEATGGDFVKVSACTALGCVASKTVPSGRGGGAQVLMLESPVLWSPASPFLYELRLQVVDEGEVTDCYTVPFGVRKVELDTEEGLKINGLSFKLKGVNMHHNLGCLGAAVSVHALRRRLSVFKKMGCNAIRMSHNPPAKELLRLCDEMGFFVVDEALDKWVSGSYERYYADHAGEDVTAMVIRDRNHPSVLLWSVGNEVEEQGSEAMIKRMAELTRIVRELDDTRPVTYAMMPVFQDDPTQTSREKSTVVHRMAEHLDLLSLNYQEQWYEVYHEDTPDKLILGTEVFPYFRGQGELVNAYYDRNPWLDVEEKPYVAGAFVWAGIDYLGESAGWPSKGWTASLLDLLGNRRPVSYLWESFWSEEPMVHITFLDGKRRSDLQKDHWGFPKTSSHWNFSGSGETVIPFQIYTNCEAAAVYLNGQYYQTVEKKDFHNRILTGFLPNLAGVVEVKGLRSGEEICSHILRTAAAPHHLEVTFDRETLEADGVDLLYADVRVVDENGVLCPEADNMVRFEVTGAGVLQAVDNGDLLSEHNYHGQQVAAFRGKCGCVVKSLPQGGEIRLDVCSEGLEGACVTIESREPQVEKEE